MSDQSSSTTPTASEHNEVGHHPATNASPEQSRAREQDGPGSPSANIAPASPEQSRAREQAGPGSPKATIAHLPKETRDMINLMLDDGLPYHILIEELGEAGQGLKPENLTDWVQGEYQEYLKNREDIDRAKTQMEFATDLIRGLGDTDPSLIYRACSQVAALQIFDAIMDHGDAALREMLHVNPASYLTMINTLCNMTDSTLKAEKHRLALESATPKSPATQAKT